MTIRGRGEGDEIAAAEADDRAARERDGEQDALNFPDVGGI